MPLAVRRPYGGPGGVGCSVAEKGRRWGSPNFAMTEF
jgi:hypothetical protein